MSEIGGNYFVSKSGIKDLHFFFASHCTASTTYDLVTPTLLFLTYWALNGFSGGSRGGSYYISIQGSGTRLIGPTLTGDQSTENSDISVIFCKELCGMILRYQKKLLDLKQIGPVGQFAKYEIFSCGHATP